MFGKPEKTISQKGMILNHLKSKGTISGVEALSLYRIYRLAARVEELRRSGHTIETDMKTDLTGKRYARYRLV
jgi:hypothetical protein